MRQDYVLGFAFAADRTKLVLIHKTRPAWQAGKFNGPGGKIDAGETPIAAMCREFVEETGVATAETDWHHYANITGHDGQVFCFRLFDDKILGAKTMEDQEIVLVGVNLDAIRRTAMSNLAWLIAVALDETQPIFFVEAKYDQFFLTGKNGDA